MSGKRTKKEKKALIIISVVVFAVIVMTLIFTFAVIKPFSNITPIDLGSENYDVSEVKDLTADQYNQMISEKKSFVLMIDNPGCVTTANMREMMSDFSNNMKFTYYRIYWQDTKDTNIREKVQYFPSLAIIDEGKIIAALQADSDEDAKYYNNASDLAEWLKKYVKF